jgi:hypothetical protein
MMHLIALAVTSSGVEGPPHEHSTATNRQTAAKDNNFFILVLF